MHPATRVSLSLSRSCVPVLLTAPLPAAARCRTAGVCVEPFPTHSYEGGQFGARRCLLVDRALTGSLDGKVVAMEGDGTDQSTSLDLEKAKATPSSAEMGTNAGNAWVTTTISITSLLACVNGTSATPCVANGGGGAAVAAAAEGAGGSMLPSFINFVSMDVEGLEYDVLQAWPFAKVGQPFSVDSFAHSHAFSVLSLFLIESILAVWPYGVGACRRLDHRAQQRGAEASEHHCPFAAEWLQTVRQSPR
jgi:hypothetical protein